ncbi:hypothetical protein ZWY2020_001426 [Hordeum vulgare]|nr:hypothetical protein ZWY2020_001426 [Hordeum vulgare]
MAMDDEQQRLVRPWFLKIETGKDQRLIPSANLPIWVTDVFLVDPASAVGQGAVDACVGQGVVLASLWAERPRAKLRPAVELREECSLYVTLPGADPSSAGANVVVQFEGSLVSWYDNIDEEQPGRFLRRLQGLWSSLVSSLAARSASGQGDGQAVRASSAGMGEANRIDEEYEGEEESDDEVDGQAPGTAGIMRVAAAGTGSQKGNGKHISVIYRHTHFSATSESDRGVQQVRGSTKVYQLGFAVPPAGDTARELRRWVGASVAPLVYDSRFHRRLQRLWSSLIADVIVPPHAERVEVFVDVGILRPEDRTPERMERVSAALEGMADEPLLGYHAGMELHLPEPVRCDAGEEDCPVCLELLKGDDLAAWPGCGKPHVFHGACLELVLRKSDRCPLCRRSCFKRTTGVIL